MLGDFHDAHVAEAWLRGAAAARGAGSIERAVAAGQLIANQRRAAVTSEGDWRSAWKTASSKKLRQPVIS